MHAVIKFSEKHSNIYLLHDLEIIISLAWKKNPYKVITMEKKDFLNFNQVFYHSGCDLY